jgi:MoxR-like ATPase
MTQLSSTMRTILRSRIARHRDSVLVAEFMQANCNARNTAELTKAADLLAVAAKFNILLPTKDDAGMYAARRKMGESAREAMTFLENFLRPRADLSNINPPGSDIPIAGGGGLVDDIEALEAVELEDDEAAPVEPPVEVDAEQLAAAEAEVRDILSTFSTDMSAFGPKLKALAIRANAKPVVLRPAYDASRAVGHVARCLSYKTMREVGINAPEVHAKNAATRLPVYDSALALPIDPDYVWTLGTAAMLAAIARGRNLFCVGPAGTGKTSWAEQFSARYGREFIRISCTAHTEAPVLVGMTLGKNEKHEPVWLDGQLARAIRKPGAVILIDEATTASAGAMMVFQAVLDDARKLYVQDTGEVIEVAPDVVFIVADNTNGTGDRTGQYESTRILNRATLDRLSQTIVFDYLDEVTEAKLLAKRTKCSAKLAAQLVKFASLTRTKATEGVLRNPIGFRRLRALAEAMTDGAGAEYAFAVCLLNGATHTDAERLRQMWEADFSAAAAGVEK